MYARSALAATARERARREERQGVGELQPCTLLRDQVQQAAPAFVRNWGTKGLAGHFTTPDHDRTVTRIKTINTELQVLEKTPANGAGLGDWRFRFTPFPLEARVRQ
mgnify:CR=1 FL=1